jgi:hypothetical protein
MCDEICICAAVLREDGYPVIGHRHADCFGTIADMGDKPNVHAQGFITSTGRFVTREEGYELHIKAGKPSKSPGGYRGKRLFSEDLY